MKQKFLSLIFVFLIIATVPAFANQDIFAKQINQIEIDLKNSDGLKVAKYREQIGKIRTDINSEITSINIKKTALEQSLGVVNAAIKDVKTPPPQVQKQIDDLNKEINELQASSVDLNLMLAKVDDLDVKLNEITKNRILSDVKIKHTFPFSPDFIKNAVPDIGSAFYFTVTEPYFWTLKQIKDKEYESLSNIIYLLTSAGLILIVMVIVKRIFLKHFNYRNDIEEPSYTNKLIAAFIEAVSNGIFPAVILGLVYYWLAEYSHGIEGVLNAVILGGIAVLMYLVLIHSFAKAIFSPNMINWRLTTLSQNQTKKVYRIILILGVVFGFHIFFFNILNQMKSNEFSLAFFTVIMNIIEAFLSLMLLRKNLWEREKKTVQEGEESSEPQKPTRKGINFWMMARNIISLVIIISAVASFLGYVGFGDFILKRLLYSTIGLSLLIVLRGFFHETTLLFINSEYATTGLGFSAKRLKVFRFWLMLLLDVSLFCTGVYFILPLWGVPRTDIVNTGKALATGFSVGGVTVSLINIFMAIVVFLIIVRIFSWTQRWLRSKIFPATDMESSLQDSLSAGIGYIGMIMGFFISISVLGINFTNLAIVAGALSVGIGFGLQNIVNNFVSGIIILLERPIKVGDWIIINGNEGVVSRISFRATEIETFNKASILVPNAEIISNVLLNWTHNNHYGRVDIPVSVSYKSNVEQIKEILLTIASNNSKVLFVPQPQVIFLGIDEDSMKFELRFFVSDINDSVLISSDVRYSIVKKFKEENIQIPYRHQVMHIKTTTKDEEFSFNSPTSDEDLQLKEKDDNDLKS